MKKRKIVNNCILGLGIACFVYYLGMGVTVSFAQSLLFLWPLAGALCVGRWLLVRRSLRTGEPVPVPRGLVVLWRVLLCLGLAVFLFVECFVVGGAFERAPAGLDCVVVLGARVNGREPSGSLRERIEAAADYLQANPGTLCVASGGRGADEEISEAACIRDNLVARGVDPTRITLEEESTNTATNLRNSLALLPAGTRSVGVVTSDFHVFRALCTAHALGGYDFYGVPAASTVFGFVHYSMREFFALLEGALHGELALS